MAAVRTFQNADIPEIVRVWNSHHESAGLAYAVSGPTFYAAVIDRQTFSSEDLVIVLNDDRVVGFAHAIRLDSGELRLIGVWCEAGEIGKISADTLLDYLIERGLQVAGQTIHQHLGYIGLTQYSGLVGIADADSRQTNWLKSRKFVPIERHASVQVSIPTFRPPVDRKVLMLRRTVVLQEAKSQPDSDAVRESGWGYLDPLTLQLCERTGRVLAQITAWNSGFGEVFPYSDTLLSDLIVFPGAPEGSDALIVTEAMRDLGARRFLTARTVVDDAHPAAASFWQSLGFRIVASGAVYSR